MARSFNGSSQYVSTGQSGPSFDQISSVITIAGWINPAVLNTNPTAFTFGINANINFHYELRVGLSNANGWIDNRNTTAGGSGDQTATTSNSISSANTWNHICGIFDSTGSTLAGTVILNANFGSQGTFGGVVSPTSNTIQGTAIGCLDLLGVGQFNFFQGLIADVAVWKTELTNLEISALFAGARPYTIRTGSLVSWFPVDGLQSPEVDLAGNNTATVNNSPPMAPGPPIMQLTPRWPQFLASAAATFKPGWASRSNIIFDGVAT